MPRTTEGHPEKPPRRTIGGTALEGQLERALRGLKETQTRLEEAEETLRAIRAGEVDAILSKPGAGESALIDVHSAEKPYRVFVEAMAEGAVLVMEDGTITFCNESFAAMVGRPVAKTIGAKLPSLAVPTDRDKLERLVRQGRERAMRAEVTLLGGESLAVPVSFSASPFDDGDTHGSCLVATNLTEQKRHESLEQEQKWLEAMLDLMPVPLLLVEPGTARVTFANKEADRLAGGSFPTENPADVFHARQFCVDGNGQRIGRDSLPWVRAARGEKLTGFQMDCHAQSGMRSFVVHADSLPSMHGRPPVVVLNFLDITDLKHSEQRLKERAEALARSNAELEQFAYVASHDLKEPLRMIRLYAQLLQKRYADRLDQEANDFIRFAVEGAERMHSLIHDLLAFSRVGQDETPHARVELEPVFATVLRNLDGLIAQKGGCVTSGPLPAVRGNGLQLTQLFQNLLENSLKYHGPRPPNVHVEAERSGREWVFTVRDNGIGIPAEYKEKIFILFKRLHTKEEYPGTGIGLSICKKIVERHGGRIWLETHSGKQATAESAEGAVFHFTLPAAPES